MKILETTEIAALPLSDRVAYFEALDADVAAARDRVRSAYEYARAEASAKFAASLPRLSAVIASLQAILDADGDLPVAAIPNIEAENGLVYINCD